MDAMDRDTVRTMDATCKDLVMATQRGDGVFYGCQENHQQLVEGLAR